MPNPVQYNSSYPGGWDTVPQTAVSVDLTLNELVQMFVVYAFIIAAALSAVFIFVGGMSFILSGGNDEKIKQAVNTIRYSIVGLIVTLLSFTFVHIVGKVVFKVDLLGYLSWGQTKEYINRLIQTGSTPSDGFNRAPANQPRQGQSGGGFQGYR